MDLHIVHNERFRVTSPDLPGAQATADELDVAIQRLHTLHDLAHRPSPFATVRKRLEERHAETTASW